jgi:Ser/Thr protein kinase RdoA (MazF antagonist)
VVAAGTPIADDPWMGLSAEFISSHWPLDHVRLGPLLQRYPRRVAFAIGSTQGNFVVKVYDNPVALSLVSPSPERIHRCLHVFGYLGARGFPHIPTLLPTRDGESFLRTATQTIYLLERISGTQPAPTPENWRALGRVAARLNAHTDFPFPYPISVNGTIDELQRAAAQYPFRKEFLDQVAKLAVLADQPASLIHAEINPANAFRTPDGRYYLLDWDNVGHGPTVLEAGFPLITCFLSEEDLTFQRDWGVAFYEGYTAGAGMTVAHKELVFIAALLHALRYLDSGGTPLRRWARICHAVEHQDVLLSIIPGE